VDENLGSCGELSEWVDGRTWRLEVDDHLDYLKQWQRGNLVDRKQLDSPEYRAKRKFMSGFVRLLHDMGAYEFARQYEWWTCKSQPNCLKRSGTDDNPAAGLVAVDFRAGLALLPFLPMSPGDFKLIAGGIKRGSIVQFDRGDIDKLGAFVDAHSSKFADMRQMLDELKSAERLYRDSAVDITHNHIRLFYDRRLYSTIADSAVTGWRVRNIVDDNTAAQLRRNKILLVIFLLLGFIPFLGKFIRRLWARPNWRRHYFSVLTNWNYFVRALNGKAAEKIIIWHRAGRVSAERAVKLSENIGRCFCHLPFLLLIFPGLHRFFTDGKFAKEKLAYLFVRPVRLYFNAHLREQWLRDMVKDGKKKHLLTENDADVILSQLDEPYIQRYLISLVVHLMTLPITQIVSAIFAWIYYRKTGDKWGAGGILILFQVMPISPGSICRGLYAVGIAIYDRSFKDYNIAVFLSFFKYIGYLAFPIQMTYHYPALARFMAGHWATEATHIVPVFGERGALLEHWVFCLFYNQPLTIRRRMRRRAEVRAMAKPRYWHVLVCAMAAALFFTFADAIYLKELVRQVRLRDIWLLAAGVPLICGAVVTLGCGGAVLGRRIIAAVVCGGLVGVLYTTAIAITGHNGTVTVGSLAVGGVWRVFVFCVFAAIGAVVTELRLPDPDLK